MCSVCGLFALFLEDAEFHQEIVSTIDGHFEIRVADVEIEEAVFCAGEIEEAAVVSAPFHAPAEGGDFFERCYAIGLPMEEHHGRKLAFEKGGRAEKLAHFTIRESLRELSFGGGIDQGAEEDEGFGSDRRRGVFILFHGED